MGRIIASVNEKGGVAKTTTVKNLSIGLAAEGKKVLVIDLDPNASLSKILGLHEEGVPGGICRILELAKECEDIPKECEIVHQEEGIDVVTSSDHLRALQEEMATCYQREIILRRYLITVKDNYDYIFVDCASGLGLLVMNALFAADALIIPMEAQLQSVEVLPNLVRSIAMVRKLNGTKVKPAIMGILFTKIRINTNNDRNIMEEVRRMYGTTVNVFQTFIPMASKITESDVARQSIFKYAPGSTATMIYKDLVSEFLEQDKLH